MPHHSELNSQQIAGLAILAKSIAGNPLTPSEKTEAEFLLAGLVPVITQNLHLTHLIYNSAMAAQRRAAV